MISAVPSRPDSPSSNSSINTLEDLSLAFKQTIAMGEEALGLDSDIYVNENIQGIMNEDRLVMCNSLISELVL